MCPHPSLLFSVLMKGDVGSVSANARATVIIRVETNNLRIRLGHAKGLVSTLGVVMTNMHVAISLARKILCRTVEGTVSTVLAGLICSRRGGFVRCSSIHTATTTVYRHLEVVNTNGPGGDAVGNVSLETELQNTRSVPFIANFEADSGLEVIGVGIEADFVFRGATTAASDTRFRPGTPVATEQLNLLSRALNDHVEMIIRAFTVNLV